MTIFSDIQENVIVQTNLCNLKVVWVEFINNYWQELKYYGYV